VLAIIGVSGSTWLLAALIRVWHNWIRSFSLVDSVCVMASSLSPDRMEPLGSTLGLLAARAWFVMLLTQCAFA